MAYLPNFEIVSLRLIARHLQLEMHSDHVNNASYNSVLSMGRCPGSLLNFFRFLPCYSFEASWFYLIPDSRFFSLYLGCIHFCVVSFLLAVTVLLFDLQYLLVLGMSSRFLLERLWNYRMFG